jgi:hypothetical protein
LKVNYYEYSSADKIISRLTQLAPRAVIFDVEPTIAHWNTGELELDDGVSCFIRKLSAVTSVQVLIFATNSSRQSSTMPTRAGIEISGYRYEAISS